MDINNIQRKYRKTGPKVNINLKVSEDVSKWLREMNYSPTGIFNEALRELGCPALRDPEEEGNIAAGPTDKDRENEVSAEEPHPQSYAANAPRP